jgi:hypothetical protein
MTDLGLSASLKYYEYEFDSAEAVQSFNINETSLDWPNFQFTNPLTNIAGMKVLEAQIPFSFYSINDRNKSFILTSTSGTFTVTLPVGNYDSNSLLSVTKAAMLLVDPAGAYTITFSANTGKYTFLAGIPFSMTFGTVGGPSDVHPGANLGFNSGTTATALVIPAPKVAAINGPTYLYVCSDSLGPLCQLYLPVSSEATSSLSQGGLGPEMAKIPINANPYEIIDYKDPDPEKYFNIDQLFTLQGLDLYLTIGTSFQKPVRLNGLPFSVKLGIIVKTEINTFAGTSFKRGRVI